LLYHSTYTYSTTSQSRPVYYEVTVAQSGLTGNPKVAFQYQQEMTEVPLSKAPTVTTPNECINLDGLNAEDKFRVSVAILGLHMTFTSLSQDMVVVVITITALMH